MNIDAFLDKESKSKEAEKDTSDKQSGEKPVEPPSGDFVGEIVAIKALMTEKKFEEAERKYKRVREAFAEFSKKQKELHDRVYAELIKINQDMVVGLNSLRQETEVNIQRVYELIRKVKDRIAKNEIDVANQLDASIESMWKGLSDLVPEKKVQLEHEIAAMRVELRGKSNLAANAEFQTKFQNIHNMLTYATELTKRGRLSEAVDYYQRINTLYDELPPGFLYEKALLYQQILKLYQSVNQSSAGQAAPQTPGLSVS